MISGSRADPPESLPAHRRIVRLPRDQIERRPARVEPAVPSDDVRDSFGFHFPFRPLVVVLEIDV